jgi:purine-binding chemotaxis protein CheW
VKQAELVLFRAGGALYAMDILEVMEIKRIAGRTKVRHAPPCVLGVVNLRGQIVTLIDIAALLGQGAPADAGSPHIVFVMNGGELVGLAVDEVRDAVLADGDAILPIPGNVPPSLRKFFRGIYPSEDGPAALLDRETLLAVDGR